MVARGVLGSVLVTLGGLVVATLPASTPLLGLDALVALRSTELGRTLGLTVVIGGLGILAAQWLRLCRSTAAGDRDPDDDLALVRRVAVWWSVPLVLAPPLFSRDGWSYPAQGALVAAGVSPYDHGPGVLAGAVAEAVDPRWTDTPAPYGPVPLLLGGVGASVTSDPWLPFAACLRLPRAGTAVVLVLSLVLGLASPLDSSLHGAYLAIAWGCLLLAAITPLLLATRAGRDRVDRITEAHLLPT